MVQAFITIIWHFMNRASNFVIWWCPGVFDSFLSSCYFEIFFLCWHTSRSLFVSTCLCLSFMWHSYQISSYCFARSFVCFGHHFVLMSSTICVRQLEFGETWKLDKKWEPLWYAFVHFMWMLGVFKFNSADPRLLWSLKHSTKFQHKVWHNKFNSW